MSVTINGTTGIDTIQDGIVTTAKIAADAVTTPKIADTVNLGTRNRIINGLMLIDQRNSGGVWNAINGGYGLDRWKVNSFNGGAATGIFSVQRSTTAPDGFSHSLLVTSLASTADNTNNIFNVEQQIEGYNTFDLGFGTSSAKTITLSFWVRSSLTGTFGGAIKNSARNRAYPFTYTISSANTFEYKTITIAGDTSGTWVGTSTSTGVWVSFGLGVGSSRSGTAGAWNSSDDFSATGATSVVGTSGATWYLTGVQLEAGDTATSFEYENYTTTLSKCERYFQRSWHGGETGYPGQIVGVATAADLLPVQVQFRTQMRTTPTFTFYRNGTSGTVWNVVNTFSVSVTIAQAWYDRNGIGSILATGGGSGPFGVNGAYGFDFDVDAEI